jgi:enamine deaminase RidA (YjgF/YER057c/UK114 family)
MSAFGFERRFSRPNGGPGPWRGGDDMANMTRRTAIGASAGAVGLVGLAQAAEPNRNVRAIAMDDHIERYEPSPSLPGIPLISYAVVHRDIVYLSGITASSTKSGDVKDQTRQIVARIDALLAKAGSNKSKLLPLARLRQGILMSLMTSLICNWTRAVTCAEFP